MSGQPGDVPAGPRQAGDEAARHRITGDCHDDGDRAGRLLGSPGGWVPPRVTMTSTGRRDQLGRERGQPFVAPVRRAYSMIDILALDVAESRSPCRRTLSGPTAQLGGGSREPDPVAPSPAAAACHGSRPHPASSPRPAARAHHELPAAQPAHSITSVTWSMISLGKVMPSSRAVFRLTTKSKVIGCSTGRSAGLAPLRMRST